MKLAERLNQRRRRYPREISGRGWDLVKRTCAGCGKRCYATRADAKRAGRQIGGHARAYRCGDWWHLTSQDTETVTRYREQP